MSSSTRRISRSRATSDGSDPSSSTLLPPSPASSPTTTTTTTRTTPLPKKRRKPSDRLDPSESTRETETGSSRQQQSSFSRSRNRASNSKSNQEHGEEAKRSEKVAPRKRKEPSVCVHRAVVPPAEKNKCQNEDKDASRTTDREEVLLPDPTGTKSRKKARTYNRRDKPVPNKDLPNDSDPKQNPRRVRRKKDESPEKNDAAHEDESAPVQGNDKDGSPYTKDKAPVQSTPKSKRRVLRKGKSKEVEDKPEETSPTSNTDAVVVPSTTRKKASKTDGFSRKSSRNSTARLRKELDSLQKEMEVAHYIREENGNVKKYVKRSKAAFHTQQRMSLEREDKEMFATDMPGRRKRMRGSKAAQEEDVIKGSLIFAAQDEEAQVADIEESEEDLDNDDEEEEQEGEEQEEEQEEEGGDDEESGEDVERDEGEADSGKREIVPKQKKKGRSKRRSAARSGKKATRLRNFRSQRLAQREGEAIALHIQGRHALAIEKLKELASDAPSAPQVYSALGTVYEAMLKELKKSDGEKHDDEIAKLEIDAGVNEAIPRGLNKQIQLAQKAYVSFHLSAVLYRRDYTLWVRSGDLSLELADLYTRCLSIPELPAGATDMAIREKKRWLSEAKNDYQAADNLHPPGIDVGAKLATIYIELGNLSEALTLLTDMKSRKGLAPGRTEFDSSYKVWLLYADLMLRIGFECKQWNSGECTNDDYMFRRWLRKFSNTFDWRERRMQALTKALEAAAGTKNCIEVIKWQNARAATIASDRSTEDNNVAEVDTKKSSEDIADEEDKKLLEKRKDDDLADFDRLTAAMELPKGSKAAKAREEERSKILKRVLPEITKAAQDIETAMADPASGEHDYPLPLSASVGTVCDIASDLMKQMIVDGQFEGCYRVGESVSLYLKERSKLVDKRRTRFDTNSIVFPEIGAAYDNLNAGSDGEESVDLISDDDALDGVEDDEVIDHMRKGVLTPLLRALYGLGLLGANKKRFLAVKCVESIANVPMENEDWFLQDSVANEASSWSQFVNDYSRFSGRTHLLGFAAEVLFTVKDDKTLAWMTNLFQEIDRHLQEIDTLPEYHAPLGHLTPVYLTKMECILKISSALTRCLSSRVRISKDMDGEAAEKLALSLTRTTKLSSVQWRLGEHGSLPKFLSNSLKSVMEAFQVLREFSGLEGMNIVREDLKSWVSRFCIGRSADLDNLEDEECASILNSSSLPLDDAWLTPMRRKVSTRCHNLVVATAVENFSGWQEQEFSNTSIRRSEKPTYVGIRCSDGIVSGLLRRELRFEAIRQWANLQTLKPEFEVTGKILDMFSNLEDQEWYQEESKRLRDPEGSGFVAYNGEYDALCLCLQFSSFSLDLAAAAKEAAFFNGHIFNALSVLVPLSQFCLNVTFCNSTIGVLPAAAVFVTVFSGSATDTLPLSSRPGYIRPAKKAATERKRAFESKYLFLDAENRKLPFSNLLHLPCTTCRKMWGSEASRQELEQEEFDSMNSLHEKIQQLRQCYSVEAAERAALEIASGLLSVASSPSCENIFLVLHQAANFASKGRRAGNNDRFFKGKLPSQNCTTREMMVLLGRADCLQSIGFVAESSFLISFVVKHCHAIRKSAHVWNDRWKLVAFHAYNLSLIVRMNDSNVFGDNYIWEANVLDELSKIREEAKIIFKRARVAGPLSAIVAKGKWDSVEVDGSEDEDDRIEAKGKRSGRITESKNGSIVAEEGAESFETTAETTPEQATRNEISDSNQDSQQSGTTMISEKRAGIVHVSTKAIDLSPAEDLKKTVPFPHHQQPEFPVNCGTHEPLRDCSLIEETEIVEV